MYKQIVCIALTLIMGIGTAVAQRPGSPNSQNVDRNSPQNERLIPRDKGRVRPHARPPMRPHDNGVQTGLQGPKEMALPPLQYGRDSIELTLKRAFPEAKSVKATDQWTEVYNAKGKLIGYAVYSKPSSNGIRGYNGETPIMIALNKKKVIQGVYLLPNLESPGFVRRVTESGFFNSWNGMKVKKAIEKKVDAVSGATFTSAAVAESVRAALKRIVQ